MTAHSFIENILVNFGAFMFLFAVGLVSYWLFHPQPNARLVSAFTKGLITDFIVWMVLVAIWIAVN